MNFFLNKSRAVLGFVVFIIMFIMFVVLDSILDADNELKVFWFLLISEVVLVLFLVFYIGFALRHVIYNCAEKELMFKWIVFIILANALGALIYYLGAATKMNMRAKNPSINEKEVSRINR